jgi:dihydrofolate synthase/folylpolyglutamate synthase
LGDYDDRLDYLYGRLNYERVGMPRASSELRLGRMRRLMRRLGDPHLDLRVIHIAGTKGKGSTAAMMAAALTAAGLRTGLYCSPHLHRLEERYTIDGVSISPSELGALVDEVREAVDELDSTDAHSPRRRLTFFEITTAMGLLHFARSGVDTVVLEVGVGGRLDSTNVVHPVLSIITSIALDHVRQLGNSLESIAREKAGILKRGRPAISGTRGADARQAIRAVARARRCPLRELDTDFWFDVILPVPPLSGPATCQLALRTWRSEWDRLQVPLLGPHQAHNAAIALAGLDVLAELDPNLAVGREDVVRGFASLRWPARVELAGERPYLVIDGAHNPASAAALAETLRVCFPPLSRTLIFGTTRDKDLEGQLRALLPLFDTVIATRYVENPRAVPPSTICSAVAELTGQIAHTTSDPAEALELARQCTASDALICVTGSLFLAAEARASLLPQRSRNLATGAVR